MNNAFIKDDEAVLDYQFDWAAWLAAGETITSATVTASPAGLTVGTPTVSTTAVTVRLSDGAVNQTYAVTCHIVTTAGQEDDRTFYVRVAER